MVQFFKFWLNRFPSFSKLNAMISLVNFFGFLIQMVLCPVVMLPWLLIRLLVSKGPVADENNLEFSETRLG